MLQLCLLSRLCAPSSSCRLQLWAFDQASRLRLAHSDLCMTAAVAPAAGKLFAAQPVVGDGRGAADADVQLRRCGGDVRQTFSMLSQSGASPSPGASAQTCSISVGTRSLSVQPLTAGSCFCHVQLPGARGR